MEKIGLVPPSETYQNEIVNPDPGDDSTTGETTYDAKIGLMYASEYAYAASPSAWETTLVNYKGNDSNGVAISTFSLVSAVSYKSGDGSKSNPFKINE